MKKSNITPIFKARWARPIAGAPEKPLTDVPNILWQIAATGQNNSRRISGMAALRLAAAAVTTILAIPTLAAAGPGVIVVEQRTNSDLVSPKEITAVCPPNTLLIGAGWGQRYGSHYAVIDEARPESDRVTVRGAKTPVGPPTSWSLVARAICASGISNVQIVHQDSVINNLGTPKTAVATCPFGTRVVGTAFEALGPEGEVMVTKIDPTDYAVSVKAYPDDTGIAGSWGVTAWAVCASAPAGLEIVSRTLTPANPSGWNYMDVHTVCPRPKVAIGAGAYFNDVAAGNVMLFNLNRFQYQGDEMASSQATEDHDGTPAAWNLTTKAICANP